MSKEKVNKAAAVRQYLKAHPTEKPKAVAAAVSTSLKVKVSPNYVSIIKSSDKAKGRAGKKKGGGTLPYKAALQIIEAVGLERGIELLETVAAIRAEFD